MKKYTLLVVSFVLFSLLVTTTYAQSSANASVSVNANILQGLTISLVSGSLDFGDIVVTGSPQNPSITPDNGALFIVTGSANTPVTVTYSNVTLDNNAWVGSHPGATAGTMDFTPSVEHTSVNTYSGANPISSGGSFTLTDETNGIGNGWLWTGGSLAVGANQPPGVYVGTFTISVAY